MKTEAAASNPIGCRPETARAYSRLAIALAKSHAIMAIGQNVDLEPPGHRSRSPSAWGSPSW